MTRLARKAAESGVAAIVFPELSVTGYTCGDIFFRDGTLSAAESALAAFVRETADLPIVSVVGFPERDGNCIFNAAAVTHGGKIVGVVRKRHLPTYREYYEARQFTPAPDTEPPKIFDAGGLRFCVEICEDLWAAVPPSSLAAASGVDVVFNLSASTDYLGKSARRREMVRQQSQRLGCAYAMACAGMGESSSDAVFGGDSMIAVGGRIAADSGLFAIEPSAVEAVVDVGALRFRRRSSTSLAAADSVAEVVAIDAKLPEADPDSVSRSPFIDEFGEPDWHRGILAIQAAALARRMESAHSQKLVVGVSGGADSALALLGAAAALDRLGLPRANLIAVVMPGFGSTGHTQNTAAEQVKPMILTACSVERLSRDVPAAMAANLPASPRHRPATLVLCQLLHVSLGNADVVNILRPKLDLVTIVRHISQHHFRDFHIVRRLRGLTG